MSHSSSFAKTTIKPASGEDLIFALRSGLNDFSKHPWISAFFGAFYVMLGYVIIYTLFILGKSWAAIPFAIGFPLVAPFVAAGIYDISRRLERNEPVSFAKVLTVVWRQKGRELGWMAFTVLFVFWVWIYQIRLLVALLLPSIALSSSAVFLHTLATSTDGWLFLGVGSVVGAVISTVLFCVTVISMPLLLDQEVDFITAMITSVQTVVASPLVLFVWGMIVAAGLFIAIIPAMLGLIAILPILGHASWHLYRRLIVTNIHP